MIENDAAILSQFVEEWEREIALYVERYKDNMVARQILDQRDVGEDVQIDVVQKYDRTGPGAQITAKGSAPESMGLSATSVNHEVFQIATGFYINQKDLKSDPKSKNRLVDIAMRDIHRAEDDFALNGSTKHNVNGIVGASVLNSNGKITAGTNKGKWTGETGTDIYDDINSAIALMDDDFEPAFLVGKRSDLLNLNRMDSERQAYYKTVAGLFGKRDENDKSWLMSTNHLDAGKVYVIPKDFMAGEFVIGENAHIIDDYPMEKGQNYWVEVTSWVVPEIHQNDAFVEIAIT
jgi:hypothetical protein